MMALQMLGENEHEKESFQYISCDIYSKHYYTSYRRVTYERVYI